MARNVKTSEWLYLGVSLLASYVLIQMQRDPDYDVKLNALRSAFKVVRAVRRGVVNTEAWLMIQTDKALEEYRAG